MHDIDIAPGRPADLDSRAGRVKRSVAVALALVLGACATRPPLPPECTGELVPINAPRTAPDNAGRG